MKEKSQNNSELASTYRSLGYLIFKQLNQGELEMKTNKSVWVELNNLISDIKDLKEINKYYESKSSN